MSWTLPTERVREAAFDAWQNTSASLSVRERLDAVLVAVGPLIAAQTLRGAATAADGDPEFRDPLRLKADWIRDRADRVEKEAGR